MKFLKISAFLLIANIGFAQIDGMVIKASETIIDTTTCTQGIYINGGTLTVNSHLMMTAPIILSNGGELVITASGMVTFENDYGLTVSGNSSVRIDKGGILSTDSLQLDKSKKDMIVNGYLELNNGGAILLDGRKISGFGIVYVENQSALDLRNKAKIMGKNIQQIQSDTVLFTSKTIQAGRMLKFRLPYDGLTLGSDLTIMNALDLNGFNIDIAQYNLYLPANSFCDRIGGISEYVKTSETGKFKMMVNQNKVNFTAPIGRNPYLPVTVNCEDCAGATFSIGVTQGAFENPESKTGIQTANAVGETWAIIPDRKISGKISFTLQWNAGENGTTSSELSGFTRTRCTGVYWHEGASTHWQNDGIHTSIPATGMGPYAMTIDLDSMSAGQAYYFGVGSAGSALPVELSSFEVRQVDHAAKLTWTTESEVNCRVFEIQHSLDGVQWTTIGNEDCSALSLTTKSYAHLHTAPSHSSNYYRLLQKDHDGAFEYSEIKELNLNGQPLVNFTMFPNPASDHLTIEASSAIDNTHLQIRSLNGSILVNQPLIWGKAIDLSSLPQGMFIVQLTHANGQHLHTQKLVRE